MHQTRRRLDTTCHRLRPPHRRPRGAAACIRIIPPDEPPAHIAPASADHPGGALRDCLHRESRRQEAFTKRTGIRELYPLALTALYRTPTSGRLCRRGSPVGASLLVARHPAHRPDAYAVDSPLRHRPGQTSSPAERPASEGDSRPARLPRAVHIPQILQVPRRRLTLRLPQAKVNLPTASH